MRNFRNLKIWNKEIEIRKQVYLLVAENLNYISKEKTDKIKDLLTEEGKMLNGLITKLKS